MPLSQLGAIISKGIAPLQARQEQTTNVENQTSGEPTPLMAGRFESGEARLLCLNELSDGARVNGLARTNEMPGFYR